MSIVNTAIKYYEQMILGWNFDLASLSENSIVTISKATQVCVDNLSGRFMKDRAKLLSKLISDLCNLSVTSEKFPNPCKSAKLKPLYKKGTLTQPSNYRPISLLALISKVRNKVIKSQKSIFLNSKNLLNTYQSGFREMHFTDFNFSYLNNKMTRV